MAFFEKHEQPCEHRETFQGFLYVNADGIPKGAIALHHANQRSAVADILLLDSFFPKSLLTQFLWYAFEQLKLRRLTIYIAAHNLKSINLVEKLGAYRGATLIDGCNEGDVYIYYLLPERCPLWSRLYGKKQRSPCGP